MNKKVKIIIISIVSVIVLVCAGFGIYHIVKNKNIEKTDFGTIGSATVTDDTTIEFSYLCPYMSENTKFEILNNKGIYVSYKTKDNKEQKINGKITSVVYMRNEGDEIKSGTLKIYVTLDSKLESGKSYTAVLQKNSIELKKEKYINPQISAGFSVTANESGKLESSDENYVNATISAPSNESASIIKEGSKYYFVFTADINGVTKYDEIQAKNSQVIFAYSRSIKNNRKFISVLEDKNAVIEVKDSSVYVKSEVPKEQLFPGDNYEYIIFKGFFTNENNSVVNDEFKGTFTFVEQ